MRYTLNVNLERNNSHYEGNLASTISHVSVMHALLNTNLFLFCKLCVRPAAEPLSFGSGLNFAIRTLCNVL